MKKKQTWLISAGILVAIAALMIWIFGGGSKTVQVSTPYCALEFPREQSEALTFRAAEKDGVYAKTFIAEIGGVEYDLFTVSFGEPAGGTKYGYLVADGKKTPIYIECYQPPEDHTMTLEQEEQFYQMLDGINDVTRSIENAEGFSKS